VIAVGGAMLALSQLVTSENTHFGTTKISGMLDGQNKSIDSNSHSNNSVQNVGWLGYLSFQNSPWILAFIMIFLFTMLGPTDVYPKEVRFWIVETTQLKAFPCILLWGLTCIEMIRCRF
jgi:hypothetical protein